MNAARFSSTATTSASARSLFHAAPPKEGQPRSRVCRLEIDAFLAGAWTKATKRGTSPARTQHMVPPVAGGSSGGAWEYHRLGASRSACLPSVTLGVLQHSTTAFPDMLCAAPPVMERPGASSRKKLTFSWAGSGLYFFWQLGQYSLSHAVPCMYPEECRTPAFEVACTAAVT